MNSLSGGHHDIFVNRKYYRFLLIYNVDIPKYLCSMFCYYIFWDILRFVHRPPSPPQKKSIYKAHSIGVVLTPSFHIWPNSAQCFPIQNSCTHPKYFVVEKRKSNTETKCVYDYIEITCLSSHDDVGHYHSIKRTSAFVRQNILPLSVHQ